ncbi:MAG: S8 family serine peptidase [Betaproteobacteria bacterium]
MNAIVVATSLLTASLAAMPAAAAQASLLINTAAGSAPAGQRQVVTSSEQLPRRVVKLDKLPSQYLEAPRAEVQALADALEKNLRDDLAKFDIQDAATMRGYIGALLNLAQFKGDWAAIPGLVAQLKALQDKPGPRATTGTMATVVAEQQTGKRDAAWVQEEVRKRYSAMNWTDVADGVKAFKGQMELLNPALVKGSFEQQVDVMARNMQMSVPESIVSAIVSARLQNELIAPLKAPIVAGLQAVIDAREKVGNAAKRDIWTPRLFTIAPTARASEVGVGIWDSGVDLALFKPTAGRGIAFDREMRPSKDLLRPLGDSQANWPQLKKLVKGSMDLQAAQDTEDARLLKQVVATLKPEQVKQFQEELSLVGVYTHGTHVAGIAVDGNPFARVYTATMLWEHRSEPVKPSEELSRRTAEAYKQIVQSFRDQKLRVVNMSWRYGASAYEGMLAWHNVGANPEERKQLARRLFAIERDALRQAIASAPEILFVAGSGNEDNNADFEEYIPAGLNLPNLLTVGAVDKAGEETSFSTFGKTVVLHANGFEVESLLPGGDRVKFSGTSMASPQVANLAAKRFALKPDLTVAQVREAILKGAERQGRVNLIHPRKSAELLGLRL